MTKVRRWPGESIEDLLYRFQNKLQREGDAKKKKNASRDRKKKKQPKG